MTRCDSRSLLVGFVVLIGSIPIGQGASRAEEGARGGISWRSDLNQANTEAKRSRRLLWIQFTGPWCHFCHLMERESFVHPKIVGQARDHFVPIKLQSDVNEDLAARCGISGLPATVLIAPSGEIVAKREGYVDSETFLTFLQAAQDQVEDSDDQSARVDGLASGTNATSNANPNRSKPRAASLAMAGYCPVSLIQNHQLVLGESSLSLEHDGKVYRFANQVALASFQRQPERFVPAYAERCPVSQVDQAARRGGHPRFGILYQGHLYLCADEAARTRFMTNPERYCHVNQAERSLCPHCWGHDFILAQGQASWTSIRGGAPQTTPEWSIRQAQLQSSNTTRR